MFPKSPNSITQCPVKYRRLQFRSIVSQCFNITLLPAPFPPLPVLLHFEFRLFLLKIVCVRDCVRDYGRGGYFFFYYYFPFFSWHQTDAVHANRPSRKSSSCRQQLKMYAERGAHLVGTRSVGRSVGLFLYLLPYVLLLLLRPLFLSLSHSHPHARRCIDHTKLN